MNDLTVEQKREVQARIHSFPKCGQAFTRYNNTQQVFSWEGLQAVGTDVLIHYLAVFGRTKQREELKQSRFIVLKKTRQ